MIKPNQFLSFFLMVTLINTTAAALPEPIKNFGHRLNAYTKCLRNIATPEERSLAKETILKDGAVIGGSICALAVGSIATIVLIKKYTNIKKQSNNGNPIGDTIIDLSSKKQRSSYDYSDSDSDSDSDSKDNSQLNKDDSQTEEEAAIENVKIKAEEFYSQYEHHPIIRDELSKLRNAINKLEKAATREQQVTAVSAIETEHNNLLKLVNIFRTRTA